jgi:hypothetical protein
MAGDGEEQHEQELAPGRSGLRGHAGTHEPPTRADLEREVGS